MLSKIKKGPPEPSQDSEKSSRSYFEPNVPERILPSPQKQSPRGQTYDAGATPKHNVVPSFFERQNPLLRNDLDADSFERQPVGLRSAPDQSEGRFKGQPAERQIRDFDQAFSGRETASLTKSHQSAARASRYDGPRVGHNFLGAKLITSPNGWIATACLCFLSLSNL